MALSDFFGFKSPSHTPTDQLPEIYPMVLTKQEFMDVDILTTYSNILIDVLERASGLKDEHQPLFWDNCLKSEKSEGLITLLSEAMYKKNEMFLVYNKTLNVITTADEKQKAIIIADYGRQGFSSTGVYVSFKRSKLTDALKIYSYLEYCTLSALTKNMALSSAIQIKLKDLRASVGAFDATEVIAQLKKIAEALRDGKDVGMDGEDKIETTIADLTAVITAFDVINKKKAFYLRLPASYITGLQTTGLGDTTSQDLKAVERGLKIYFFSVLKPVIDALFDIKITFKSDDSENLDTALRVAQSMDLVSDEFLAPETKQKIVNKSFGLPETQKGIKPVEVEPPEIIEDEGEDDEDQEDNT